MACNCGGSQPPADQQAQPNQQFEVTLSNGETRVYSSEHEAKVAVTMDGGSATYRRLS